MLHFAVWIIISNKKVKNSINNEQNVEDHEQLLVWITQNDFLADQYGRNNDPEHKDNLCEVVPLNIPVISWTDDKFTNL